MSDVLNPEVATNVAALLADTLVLASTVVVTPNVADLAISMTLAVGVAVLKSIEV